MSPVLSLAAGQIRRRPAAFAGLAVALFLAVATVTLFGSLVAAQATAPAEVARRAVAGPGLLLIAGAFGEIAVLVALFVVVNTLGFTLRQQHRDLALLRTVAATPRQVRRLVRTQVTATVLLAAVPGGAAGTLAARGFLAALQRRGLAAPGLRNAGADAGRTGGGAAGRPGRHRPRRPTDHPAHPGRRADRRHLGPAAHGRAAGAGRTGRPGGRGAAAAARRHQRGR
ncbi:FtsX-like permease family protein [Kitasatospora sp. NPDC098663]|uniref:FtsX-like permease family protein n=1 Tax=Kitasatospora sp. NPDC098663 TaxID=3364096 RepID=UPI0037F7940F